VWNVVLDFAGAVLSLAQLVGDAVDLNDYSSITGNVAKLGLSIISIGFDVSNQEVPWFILYRPFFLQIIILET
jgi:cystinosin